MRQLPRWLRRRSKHTAKDQDQESEEKVDKAFTCKYCGDQQGDPTDHLADPQHKYNQMLALRGAEEEEL